MIEFLANNHYNLDQHIALEKLMLFIGNGFLNFQ
jgi:hypothetical protein